MNFKSYRQQQIETLSLKELRMEIGDVLSSVNENYELSEDEEIELEKLRRAAAKLEQAEIDRLKREIL